MHGPRFRPGSVWVTSIYFCSTRALNRTNLLSSDLQRKGSFHKLTSVSMGRPIGVFHRTNAWTEVQTGVGLGNKYISLRDWRSEAQQSSVVRSLCQRIDRLV